MVDFMIKDGDFTMLVSDVFARMCDFWERLYRQIGYLEDIYVDGT